MPLERSPRAFLRSDVFEPNQTVPVRIFRRNDIGVAITIDVVRVHLRATSLREGECGERPGFSRFFRLSPPTMFHQEVLSPVPIDVANTKAVGEPATHIRGRDGVKRPSSFGVRGIPFRPTQRTTSHAN